MGDERKNNNCEGILIILGNVMVPNCVEFDYENILMINI